MRYWWSPEECTHRRDRVCGKGRDVCECVSPPVLSSVHPQFLFLHTNGSNKDFNLFEKLRTREKLNKSIMLDHSSSPMIVSSHVFTRFYTFYNQQFLFIPNSDKASISCLGSTFRSILTSSARGIQSSSNWLFECSLCSSFSNRA